MSLREAYSLAHTAQCRLQMEVGRPGRNLRFIVGHLMHYESLRLRIVEIEHDTSKSNDTPTTPFKGTGAAAHGHSFASPATQGGVRSPPPKALSKYEEDDQDDQDFADEVEEDELSLTRFPSGASQPARAPPDLVPDDPREYDVDGDDEPVSPDEIDQATLEMYVRDGGNDELTTTYNSIRKCPCHGQTDAAPIVERLWEIPGSMTRKDGVQVQRAIAQVT